jgi:hypothetical protein
MACRKCEGEVKALQEQIEYLRKQVNEKDILLAARPLGESAFQAVAHAKALAEETEEEEINPEEIEGAMPRAGVDAYMRYLHGDALTGVPLARGGPIVTQEEQ